MDGFEVMPMAEASSKGDLFVTATGNRSVITKEDISRMKNGAILCNSGHFDVEIDVRDLEKESKGKREIRKNTTEYEIYGKKIYLLAEGRLVNLGAAEGHPSEVMDMSFCNQALSAIYIAGKRSMPAKVYDVFEEIDEKVAKQKLLSMGIKIDNLTEAQKRYMNDWESGT